MPQEREPRGAGSFPPVGTQMGKGGGVYLMGAAILMVLSGFCACPAADRWPMDLLAVPFLLMAWWRGVRWQKWVAISLVAVSGIFIFMGLAAE